MVLMENDADVMEAMRSTGKGLLHVFTSNAAGPGEKKVASPQDSSSAADAATTTTSATTAARNTAAAQTPPPNAAPLIATLMQGLMQAKQPSQAPSSTPSSKSPMDTITGLASSPQGAQLLSMLGLTPAMVGPILNGEQDFPPHIVALMRNFGMTPEMARAMLTRGGPPQSNVENSNVPATPPPAPDHCVSICDICDCPIAPDELRWQCTSCEDFDMHAHCRQEHTKSTGHVLTTEFISEESLAQLVSLGFDHDLCMDMLNTTRGDFQSALNTLLALQNE